MFRSSQQVGSRVEDETRVELGWGMGFGDCICKGGAKLFPSSERGQPTEGNPVRCDARSTKDRSVCETGGCVIWHMKLVFLGLG